MDVDVELANMEREIEREEQRALIQEILQIQDIQDNFLFNAMRNRYAHMSNALLRTIKKGLLQNQEVERLAERERRRSCGQRGWNKACDLVGKPKWKYTGKKSRQRK